MATPSLPPFADTLHDLHLLEADQVEEIKRDLVVRFPTTAALARELVHRGWLTPFQAQQLVLGQGDSLVLGSYVLLERLGEGGMGQVFRARNWKFGKIVALKLVRPDRSTSQAALQRFRREIAATSQLQHPNVVQALDADECNGICLLAMEYVDGIDLARVVAERGLVPVAEACDYIRQAALGLQHAHERGLVHRDIKPHNLLLVASPGASAPGVVKILDLGLARIVAGGEASSSLTETGAVLGTPDYMAPEQARDSRNADIRSDLYSLGCTLYFLLTGQMVFGGQSMTEKLIRHQMDPPPDPRGQRPDVPPELSGVIQRLLAKRPEERYQSPAELGAVLTGLLRSGRLPEGARLAEPVLAADSVPSAVAGSPSVNTWAELSSEATADDQDLPSSLGTRKPSRRRRRLRVVVAGCAVVVLAALLAGLAVHFREGPPPGPPPPVPGTLDVAASGGWQDTRVDVFEGEQFQVKAAGLWGVGGRRCGRAGLPDAPRDRAIVPTVPLMALLVRIGDDPYPQAVQGEALRASHAGRVYLRANHFDSAEATGSLQVTVSGGSASNDPRPVAGPCLAEAAETAWGGLQPNLNDPAADPATQRQDLLAFRRGYAGTPQVGRANAVLASLLSRLPSPLDSLQAASIADDQKQIAACGGEVNALDRLVGLYGDGRLRHWGTVWATLFSPNGKSVASASGREVILWDTTTGRELSRVRTDVGTSVNLGAFFPDGNRLALAGSGPAIEVWDLATGQRLIHQDCKQGGVAWVDVGTDGEHLATAGADGTIKLWDAAMKGTPKLLKGHTGKVWQVAFGRQDRLLVSASADGTVRLWDLANGKDRVFPVNKGNIYHAVLSPDGKTLAAASNTFLRLWDVETGAFKDLSNGCTGRMTFLENGKLLAVSHNYSMQFWKVADKKLARTLASRGITGVHTSFSPDGNRLAFGAGPDVKLLDLTTKNADEVLLTPRRTPVLRAMSLSADGRIFATADVSKAIILYNLATGTDLPMAGDYHVLEPYRFGLDFSPDSGWLFSRNLQGTVVVAKSRETVLGQAGKTYTPSATCYSLAVAPDGKTLACGLAGGKIELFDVATAAVVRSLATSSSTGIVSSVVYSPDGLTLAATYATGISPLFFETTTGREVREARYPSLGRTNYSSVAFSPDGSSLAVCAPNLPGKLLSANTGKELRTLPTLAGPPAFRPSGQVLAIAGSGTVDLVDVATGKSTETLRLGPSGGILTPYFAPDGRHLLTLNSNGSVYVLRLASAAKPAAP